MDFTFLNTGMRKAELENLEWDDVDSERRKISILYTRWTSSSTAVHPFEDGADVDIYRS